jgi:diguanylate cyclase (GGDEF)-like protein
MVLSELKAGALNELAELDADTVAAVIDSLSVGVMILSWDGKVDLVNESATRLFELDQRASDFAFTSGCVVDFVGPRGEALAVDDFPSNRVVRERQPVSKAVVGYDRLDGGRTWLECTAALLRPDDEKSPVALSFTDITEVRALQKRLFVGTADDQLTGLPRLPSVLGHITELLESPRTHGGDESDVVMVINFDKLRELNDSLGHLSGDEALAVTAERLRESLPQPHLLGRVVGAEFIVVLQGVDEDFIDDVSDLIHLVLTEPMTLDGVEVRLRASVGLVRVSRDDGRSAEEIVSAADTAMYYARNKGGGHTIDFNSLRIYDD